MLQTRETRMHRDRDTNGPSETPSGREAHWQTQLRVCAESACSVTALDRLQLTADLSRLIDDRPNNVEAAERGDPSLVHHGDVPAVRAFIGSGFDVRWQAS